MVYADSEAPARRSVPSPGSTPRPARRPGLVLAVVSAGFVVSAAHLSWTLGASSIVFAALFVAAGGLAHRAGRRNGSLLGLALGTLSSAWCALAEGVVAAAPGVPGDAAAGGVDDAGGQHPDAPGLLGLVAWWPPPVRPAPSSR